MALTLNIQRTAINADLDTVTWEDKTGSYDINNNAGGYGSPNETRANLGLIGFLFYKGSDGDVSETLTPDDTDPGVVASWTHAHGTDGWYQFYLFGLLDWAGGTTYNANDIIFWNTDDKFYKANAGDLPAAGESPATDPDKWIEATTFAEFEAAVITSSQADTYVDIYNWLEDSLVDDCVADKLLAANCDFDCTCGNMGQYEKFRLKHETAIIFFEDQNYTDAQLQMEDLNDQCVNSSGCGCN